MRHATPILPPAPVEGTTLREWLVGCALANPALVSDPDPVAAALRAVLIADEVIRALQSSSLPKNLDPPTQAALESWEQRLHKAQTIAETGTSPAIPGQVRRITKEFPSIAVPSPTPPPSSPTEHFLAARAALKPPQPDGRYSMSEVPPDRVTEKAIKK